MIEFHYCPTRGLLWFDIQPLPIPTKSKKRKRGKQI